MEVVIIGTGNVATVLAKVISKNGHLIKQVIGRSELAAANLASAYNADFASLEGKSVASADIYIAAISDHAIAALPDLPFATGSILVHTAGAVSKEVLKPLNSSYGILYPLQSLNKQLKVIPPFPVMVDGNSEIVISKLTTFARTFSDDVSLVGDQERLRYHVAAVVVNNFTNHLYALTEEFCKKEGIDFHKLYPLIQETTARLSISPASTQQTGPAIRGDNDTIKKHLQLLAVIPQLQSLYQVVSDSIQKR